MVRRLPPKEEIVGSSPISSMLCAPCDPTAQALAPCKMSALLALAAAQRMRDACSIWVPCAGGERGATMVWANDGAEASGTVGLLRGRCPGLRHSSGDDSKTRLLSHRPASGDHVLLRLCHLGTQKLVWPNG